MVKRVSGPAHSGDDNFRAGRPLGDDEEIFQNLFDHYCSPVFQYFVNRGFSRDESRDLAQETFLRVYRSIGGFRGEASFQTWLFLIAKNVWSNELRRRMAEKRAATVPLEDAAHAERPAVQVESEEGAEVEDRAESLAFAVRQPELEDILAQERKALLYQALAELPPQMRRCVMLRVGQDLKYREIADAMQISIDTVKSQLSQARTRLKELLGQHFPDIETG